jgi:hypothetical protein
MVECLTVKCKAMSSNLSMAKKQKKKKKMWHSLLKVIRHG